MKLIIGVFIAALPLQGNQSLAVRQITHGPDHHFFGYIGHVQNIPWNQSERYVLALRSTFQDHLPEGHEPADVVLIDMHNDYAIRKVDESRGWNPQQGTMFYWNPLEPERASSSSTTAIP